MRAFLVLLLVRCSLSSDDTTLVPLMRNSRLYIPREGIPIGGTPASYSIDVSIAGQKKIVQFDTGSCDLAVYSALCTNCPPRKRPLFDPKAAVDTVPIPCGARAGAYNVSCMSCERYDTGHSRSVCGLSITYADSSGYKCDLFQVPFGIPSSASELAPPANISAVMGAITRVHRAGMPRFEPIGIDGILGAGWVSSSASFTTSPVQILVESMGKPMFSLCLNADYSAGTIAFGGSLAPQSGGGLSAPLPSTAADQGYWGVVVESIHVGPHRVDLHKRVLNHQGVIADTGTDAICFDAHVLHAIFKSLHMHFCGADPAQHLVGVCGQAYADSTMVSCWNLTQAQLSAYPNFTITIATSPSNVPLVLPSSRWLVADGCSVGYSSVFAVSDAGGILGSVALAGMTIDHSYADGGSLTFHPNQRC